MRLWIAALLTASIAIPGFAQRGGHGGGFSASHGSVSHMGGGFGGGFRSAPPGLSTGPRSISPPRWNAPTRPIGVPPRMPNGGWGHPPAYDGHHGYRTSYPYYYPYRPYYYARSTYLVPGLLNSYWDDGNGYYGYDDPPAVAGGAVQPNGQGNDMYAQEPAPEYAPQQQAPYQAQDVPPPPPGPVEPTPLAVTTLVFKDGHSQQVHNYAMTQTTLYVLDDVASGRRVEIPLEKIDLPATQRTNQDAGIDFNVPGAGD